MTDVNAATGELFTSELLARQGETEDRKRADDRDKAETKREEGKENEEEKKTSEEISFEVTSVFDEADDSKLYFSPDQGNVIFARYAVHWRVPIFCIRHGVISYPSSSQNLSS